MAARPAVLRWALSTRSGGSLPPYPGPGRRRRLDLEARGTGRRWRRRRRRGAEGASRRRWHGAVRRGGRGPAAEPLWAAPHGHRTRRVGGRRTRRQPLLDDAVRPRLQQGRRRQGGRDEDRTQLVYARRGRIVVRTRTARIAPT